MSEASMAYAVPSEAQSMSYTSESRTYSGSRYLFLEAAKQFGVNLDPKENYDWRALLGGAYLVDHLLDVEKVDIMPGINNVISGAFRDDLHLDTQARFREYMLSQTQSRFDDITEQLSRVSSYADRQRQAQTAKEVVEVRLEEADLLARLLALPYDRDSGDETARIRFNSWLQGWSRAGYLVDSLKDMRLDYDNGDSGVEPTLKSTITMAAAATNESLIALKKTPPKLIGKCALTGVKYVILNNKPDIKTEG